MSLRTVIINIPPSHQLAFLEPILDFASALETHNHLNFGTPLRRIALVFQRL